MLSRTFSIVDPDWLKETRVQPSFKGFDFLNDTIAKFQGRYNKISSSSSSIIPTAMTVLNEIIRTKYSLTYSYLSTCREKNVPVASIINAAGVTVAPTTAGAALATTEVLPPISFTDTTKVIDLTHPRG